MAWDYTDELWSFAPDLIKLIKINIQDSATKAILYDYLLSWCFEQYGTLGIDEEFDKMVNKNKSSYNVDKSVEDIIERAKLMLESKQNTKVEK